ncbi:hypothetical protein [Cylindrospermopsis curvispora]|uniref:Uncharacterized protein n=1 Tax=Cylindrospermopsis curvispora GIHE-G1 TaxID=2666332 RepID=A0A7H0F5X3_9CYAN|nr:hypothetical protein [Cylindrospermopsis curvispora]QNP31439.1 hypothetical protein IAR63_17795 [Cylindrospermopsis curvispora GIHE-G1]
MCFINITLPTGDRSPLGSFHVRFPFGKRLTVNVFRQRINQLFQGGRDIWRGIAKHSLRAIALRDYPPVPSQGKNLNMGTGDRSDVATFHLRFPSKINQLFQCF